jgi:hypothetical protein
MILVVAIAWPSSMNATEVALVPDRGRVPLIRGAIGGSPYRTRDSELSLLRLQTRFARPHAPRSWASARQRQPSSIAGEHWLF